MCMEDIRIMRRTKSRQFSRTVDGTGILVSPAPKRIALLFSSNGALNIVGTERNMVVTNGKGFAVGDAAGASAHVPLFIGLLTHGDMVRQAWYGTVGQNYVVAETYLDDE